MKKSLTVNREPGAGKFRLAPPSEKRSEGDYTPWHSSRHRGGGVPFRQYISVLATRKTVPNVRKKNFLKWWLADPRSGLGDAAMGKRLTDLDRRGKGRNRPCKKEGEYTGRAQNSGKTFSGLADKGSATSRRLSRLRGRGGQVIKPEARGRNLILRLKESGKSKRKKGRLRAGRNVAGKGVKKGLGRELRFRKGIPMKREFAICPGLEIDAGCSYGKRVLVTRRWRKRRYPAGGVHRGIKGHRYRKKRRPERAEGGGTGRSEENRRGGVLSSWEKCKLLKPKKAVLDREKGGSDTRDLGEERTKS